MDRFESFPTAKQLAESWGSSSLRGLSTVVAGKAQTSNKMFSVKAFPLHKIVRWVIEDPEAIELKFC